MVKIFQPNFSGGVLAPGLYARSDTNKYQVGMADALNMLVKPQGGVMNRPGFRNASGMDTSTAGAYQWAIPFQFSVTSDYLLEFSEGVFRVLSGGSYVIDSSVEPQEVSAISVDDPAVVQMASSAAAAEFAAGNLVYLKDPNGSHALHQQVLRVTGVSGDEVSFEVFDGTELDTTSGNSTWGQTGAGAALSLIYEHASPYDLGDVPSLRFAQDGAKMYLAHRGYPVKVLTRDAEDDWDLSDLVYGPSIETPSNFNVTAQITTTGGTEKEYTYTVTAVHADTLEESEATAQMTVNNALDVEGNRNKIEWDAVPNAAVYNVYKGANSTPKGLMSSTTETVAYDTFLEVDKTRKAPQYRAPFEGEDNYPGVVAFVEQRLALASTNTDPARIEMSQTGSSGNFNFSYPLENDDALRFRVRSKRINEVRSMVSARALMLFTSSSEWLVSGNDNEGVLTPTSIVAKPESYWGASRLEPVVVGEAALFTMQDGNTVRDYKFDVQEGGKDLTVMVRHLFDNRFITSWAFAQNPHRAIWVTLDDGSLLSLVYMDEHEIWGWTRHKIGGTNPRVRQVVVAREGPFDVVYAYIERSLGGADVVMLERLAEREDSVIEQAFFLDAGLTYEGAPTQAISGLLHLRGETISVLADGSVVEDVVVNEAGVITVPDVSASVIHAGLPYDAYVQTLDVDFETEGLGSMQGRFKAASEVAIVIEKSRGISAGINFEDQNELEEWQPAFIGGPIEPFTGTKNITVNGDWLRNAQVVVQQKYPLPFTLNGVAPDWEAGE